MKELRDRLTDVLVGLEACIEFPTEDLDANSTESIGASLYQAIASLECLIQLARRRAHCLEGIRTPICGKRNVGKSSLLNALLGKDRALVTPYPGTTRDTIEEDTLVEGVLLHLIDTAGLGESVDSVEQLGHRRTSEAIQESELVLFVVDASCALEDEDMQAFDLLNEHFAEKVSERTLIVANKIDLVTEDDRKSKTLSEIQGRFPSLSVVSASALTGEGIEALGGMLASLGKRNELDFDRSEVGVYARQKALLTKAKESVQQALETLWEPFSRPELAVEDVRCALEALEELDGVRVCPDVLEAIFSRFCIGK